MSSKSTFSNSTSKSYALALYELAKENSELKKVMDEINDITVPFDKMLSEPPNSPGKQAAENTVSNLLLLAESFKDAGNILDWQVIIAE